MNINNKQQLELDLIFAQLDNGYCSIKVFTDNYKPTNKMTFATPVDALSFIKQEDFELIDINTNRKEIEVKTDLGLFFILEFSDFKLDEDFSLIGNSELA